MKDENSSLYRHSFLTDHFIDYCKPEILAKDSNVCRLCVKETLKIQDYYAHKALNENPGSFKLALWSHSTPLHYTCYTCNSCTGHFLYFVHISLVTEEASSNL